MVIWWYVHGTIWKAISRIYQSLLAPELSGCCCHCYHSNCCIYKLINTSLLVLLRSVFINKSDRCTWQHTHLMTANRPTHRGRAVRDVPVCSHVLCRVYFNWCLMVASIWYDMIFIYYHWVSTRWQWSVDCTQIGKRWLYTTGEIIHKTIQEHRVQKIENEHTRQEHKHKKNIKKHRWSY
jgi:hypothetical protein